MTSAVKLFFEIELELLEESIEKFLLKACDVLPFDDSIEEIVGVLETAGIPYKSVIPNVVKKILLSLPELKIKTPMRLNYIKSFVPQFGLSHEEHHKLFLEILENSFPNKEVVTKHQSLWIIEKGYSK